MDLEWVERKGESRFFRARTKLNAPGSVSHLTQRASGVDRTFIENEDYLDMLARLKHISRDYDLDIVSFVLMPNHIHLLIRQNKKNLPAAMRELFSRYARRFNEKYGRKGHLFGGPYRQATCLDDSYVLAVSLYIHLNPVRAGLVTQPSKYRWSSCRLFCEAEPPESFVKSEFVLSRISEDRKKAVEQYKSLLRHGRKVKTEDVLEDSEVIDRFRARLARRVFKTKFGRLLIEAGKGDEETDFNHMIDDFLERKVTRLPDGREARKYLVEQLLSRGYKRKEIAERLGISKKTVYNLLHTFTGFR